IKNESMNVYDGLEAISYVVIVVQPILDHRSCDTETIVICRKSDAIGFHRKLLAGAVESDLSRRVISQLVTQGRSKVAPVFYEIQDRAIGILIAGGILGRNKIAARRAGLGGGPSIVFNRGLEAGVTRPEIAVAERSDIRRG